MGLKVRTWTRKLNDGSSFTVKLGIVEGGCKSSTTDGKTCERVWVVTEREDGFPLGGRELCPFHEGGLWGEMVEPEYV